MTMQYVYTNDVTSFWRFRAFVNSKRASRDGIPGGEIPPRAEEVEFAFALMLVLGVLSWV